jgi:hypothetical protein
MALPQAPADQADQSHHTAEIVQELKFDQFLIIEFRRQLEHTLINNTSTTEKLLILVALLMVLLLQLQRWQRLKQRQTSVTMTAQTRWLQSECVNGKKRDLQLKSLPLKKTELEWMIEVTVVLPLRLMRYTAEALRKLAVPKISVAPMRITILLRQLIIHISLNIYLQCNRLRLKLMKRLRHHQHQRTIQWRIVTVKEESSKLHSHLHHHHHHQENPKERLVRWMWMKTMMMITRMRRRVQPQGPHRLLRGRRQVQEG